MARVLRRQAADLAALLDHRGVDRTVVCGVSFGGVLAQQFALNYPTRCAGLVLTDTFSDVVPRSVRDAGVAVAAHVGAPGTRARR